MNNSPNNIVSSFNSKWKYRLDKEQYGAKDSWKIIRSTDINGKYVGDCEDYALSTHNHPRGNKFFFSILDINIIFQGFGM